MTWLRNLLDTNPQIAMARGIDPKGGGLTAGSLPKLNDIIWDLAEAKIKIQQGE